MWKQWVNFILAIVVVIMASTGVAMGWMVAVGIVIALVSLWAALEGSPRGVHAHA